MTNGKALLLIAIRKSKYLICHSVSDNNTLANAIDLGSDRRVMQRSQHEITMGPSYYLAFSV